MGIDPTQLPLQMQDKIAQAERKQSQVNKSIKKASKRARGRTKSPKKAKMNKWEKQYENNLELLKQSGQILNHEFEAIKLRLADRTFYTPDFMVIDAEGYFELHEVKGFWRDDARVKIKVAAEQFPWFQFVAVTKGKGGKWEYERF